MKTSYDKNAYLKVADLGNYLRDKTFFLVTALFVWLLAFLFLSAFKVRAEIIIIITVLWIFFIIVTLAIEYFRKRHFYQNLIQNTKHLDQAYLVLETLSQPKFYDGEIIYAALYEINKSMAENINQYRTQVQDFQDYVEMWIHEVKTPLATMSLIARDPKINAEIKRLDDYVEQILYYVRAKNAERDYLIKNNNLASIINNVASRNREIILAKQIDFSVENTDYKINTDAKWVEFILNQILNNSIKYQSTSIKITARSTKHKIILNIIDNGVGISAKDLPRVFDKSFTGSNGRRNKQSTGMGLYIAKNLCQKLGHDIKITSEENKFTNVELTFARPEYYNVIDEQTYKNVMNL